MRQTWLVLAIVFAMMIALTGFMWARSARHADRLHGRLWGKRSILVASKEGRITLFQFLSHGADNWWVWQTVSYPVDDEMGFPVGSVDQYTNALGFGRIERPIYLVMRPEQTLADGSKVLIFGAATATLNGSGIIAPYWCMILLPVAGHLICAGAWLRTRNAPKQCLDQKATSVKAKLADH